MIYLKLAVTGALLGFAACGIGMDTIGSVTGQRIAKSMFALGVALVAGSGLAWVWSLPS